MNPSVASVVCAECGQNNKAQLLACNMCEGVYWCETHWSTWDSHKPKFFSSSRHHQISVSQNEWLGEMDREIFEEPSEEDHSGQHQRNLKSYWFGVNFNNSTAHINNGVYGDIILSSRFRDKTKQFPSLVSFIGATGAGKSTLIRAIINYGSGGEDVPETSTASSFWAPIAGLKAATLPTSSDVHLYHDPATIHTDRPILLADSEGLSGGNQTPVGGFVDLGAQINHLARKYILRKDTGPNLTRSYCVEHLYPRVLYAFSDILCYVIQQDPRIMESLITKMISWADNARHASLNQVTLPRVILVLNKVSMDDKERKEWEDVTLATKRVVEGLKNCYKLSDELQKIADRWNRILKKEEKVYSIMDLFLRYFKSILIVYIPPRGRTQDTSEFYGQVRQLRDHILASSQEVRVDRLRSLCQLNSAVLESLFHAGLDHFFSNVDKPFDFFNFMMASRESPKTIVANATYLMMRMRETESNHIELDERCAKLFSSYRTMKILSENIPGGSLRVEETIFTEPFGSAYVDFYTSSRCWFQVNGRQCQNTREGHTKGHMDPEGEFIASGDYQTPFKEELCDQFMRAIVSYSEPSISLLKGLIASRDPRAGVVRKHLLALKNEREFWKMTFSCKTCFSCLAEPPDFSLRCGHTICHSCVKVFGNQLRQEAAYDLDSCPLCSEGTQFEEPLAHIQLKPDGTGVRVLAIDGGGVRGVISARILQMLEKQIGLELPIFHFFDLIIGTSSGGVLSLALGTNLWSAERCLHEFKKLATRMFKRRVGTRPPILGFLVACFMTDSYYYESAIEEALKETFSDPDGEPRKLFGEPYTSTPNSHTRNITDIKVGVTAVNAITELTTLMTNYNRKPSDYDDRGAHIYRQGDNGSDIMLWEAGRCTSAAPLVFPVYRAADGHTYQDGGLNENNPIKLAMMEAQSLWHRDSRVDVALNIGTGWADSRIAEYSTLSSHAVHGWLKRCIDCFESKMDSERLWQEYLKTLDEDGRARHHRLNAKLPDTLPFLADTGAIHKMDDATKTFFEDGDNRRQLQGAAEALLASLFYVSVDGPTKCPDERYFFKAHILCRLEREHQLVLLGRLKRSNCAFRVHEGAVNIDFVGQESRLMQQEPFRQPIQWVGHLRDEFHIYLVFGEDTPTAVQQPPNSTTARAVQYEISGSPLRNSLT